MLDRLVRHLGRGDLTCVLCDHGVALAAPARWEARFGSTCFTGVAHTVHAPGGALGAVRRGIEELDSGAVLVIDTEDAEAAVWGENLTLAAQARGAAGVVVAGYVRDVPMLAGIGLPIVAWGVFPRRSDAGDAGDVGGEIRLARAGGRPDDVSAVVVRAGDVIVADLNGVVVVPQKYFQELVDHLDAWIVAEENNAQEVTS